MLRMVLGTQRRKGQGDELEKWVDWIKRSNHEAEARMATLNIRSWVETAHRRKWKWARSIAHMDPRRWAYQASNWTPDWDNGRRAQARPSTRWMDSINAFLHAKGHEDTWQKLACTATWLQLESEYVNFNA